MPDYFLDTSALAKLYHREVGSDVIEQIFQSPDSVLLISRLSTIELHSVFARRIRMGELEQDGFELLRQGFFADIVARRLTVVRVTDEHFRAAQTLLIEHATDRSLRTLDALQLAVAVDLRELGLLDRFVCSDIQLCSVATLEGLSVMNPEVPHSEPETHEP